MKRRFTAGDASEPGDLRFKARITFAWWVSPYLLLTRFGVWLGLPIDLDTVERDLLRGIRVKVELVP